MKEKILVLVKEFYNEEFNNSSSFIPGKTYINYGGHFFDEKELINLVDTSLDFWLTAGRGKIDLKNVLPIGWGWIIIHW
jgi:CDP-6-deoxy-D-xylo-4-hexulose-3-dehydrase